MNIVIVGFQIINKKELRVLDRVGTKTKYRWKEPFL